MKMMRLVLILAFVIALGSNADARRSHEPSTGLAKLHYNQAPPDFTFPEGSGYAKVSQLLGKPVVINFWTTWCHACVDEMPHFVHLQQTYGDKVAFISLSNEPQGTARAFLAQHHLPIPLLEDPSNVIFGAYSVQLYPVTVVVDARGGVSYVSVGGLDWDELQGAVSKAFASK
ncbi:MAG: TlpA family protein disulfide reductase [Candidatus Eremiobacteraeota bacterium]|nr:TlpA family protein disulfide reductase [Candidatus Eremiobacteraeota bacterium]